MLKPLSEAGVDFTVPVTVNHAVTSLFTLPEGGFYTVESLVLDSVTGVPLRPVIDYMYFQQDVENSRTTGKQIATIIQLRNKDITSVVVKGKYSHGTTQEQQDAWDLICITYKDVPLWMNWLACLDDPLQVHPNIKRMVTDPAFDKRTLSDTEVEMGYIADQFIDGDKLYLSHIEYWQQQLFLIAENKYNQLFTDLSTFLNNMKTDLASQVGDFKFTDGDAVKWAGTNKNQFKGITLQDRGTSAKGSYKYLPEGGAIPARLTNLFQRVSSVQAITGAISTNKTDYFSTDIMTITVRIDSLTNRVEANAKVQVVDSDNEILVKEFDLTNVRTGTFTFQLDLSEANVTLFKKPLVVRIPQYMWLQPVVVNVTPALDPANGYIKAELLGTNYIGTVNNGGYVNKIQVKFKRVGVLKEPKTLYVHLDGNYDDGAIKSGFPALQTFTFPTNFNESTVTVAEFVQTDQQPLDVRWGVKVSKVLDPNDATSVIAQSSWYVTAVPINPYVDWYFATKNGSTYTRTSTVVEGTEVYVVGNMSVINTLYSSLPTLNVTSNGPGSAIEGVDFIIDRANPILINNNTMAYKVTIPYKLEKEIPYKFLDVRSINSNLAELWITDKSEPKPVSAYWSSAAMINAIPTDWTTEESTFFLHIQTPNLVDGTRLTISLVKPELYRPYLTFPTQVIVYGGMAVVEVKLKAPEVANPTQFIKLLVTGPSISYTTLGIQVVDTKKPYYEIRYVVDGLPDALTALPGQTVQCQVRCIKAASGDARATISFSGSAVSMGTNMDFNAPSPNNDIVKSRILNFTTWTDVLLTPVTVKSPIRLDHLTLTADVTFPVTNGVKMGRDTSYTLNLRKA